MISARYAPVLCILVALTLVPTVIHGYLGATVNDGRQTAAIATRLGDYASVPSDRDAGWGKRRFESGDWFERRYISLTDEVLVTVLRSFDLKRLYHHPELDVAYGAGFMHHKTMRLPGRPDMPVHVLTKDEPGGNVALYVLQYGSDFIEDPLRFQARTALELLFSRRQAMTLYFAHDRVTPAGQPVAPESLPVALLLTAIVDSFNSQTSQSGR